MHVDTMPELGCIVPLTQTKQRIAMVTRRDIVRKWAKKLTATWNIIT